MGNAPSELDEDNKRYPIVVEWEVTEKDVSQTNLKQFVKMKSSEEPVIKFGTRKRRALLEFTKEKDVKFLLNQWKDDNFWTIKQLFSVPETTVVKVKNLPHTATRQAVYNYFTNDNMVKIRLELEIKEKYFRQQEGVCLLHMESAADVKLACQGNKKFKEFNRQNLALEPYYDQIDSLTGYSTDTGVQPFPIVIDNIEDKKIEYTKEFCKDSIEDQFKSICAHIVWARQGINKVKFEFACEHTDQRQNHARTWEAKVRSKFEDVLNGIVVLRKNLTAGVWDDVQQVLTSFSSRSVLLDEDVEEYRLIIVGHTRDSEIAKLESKIDAIQPPKPKEKRDIKIDDKFKLKAFADLQMHEAVGGVTIEYRIDAGVLTMHGDKEAIDKSEVQILQLLNQIEVKTSQFKSKEQAKILTTEMMRDQIEACRDDQGKRCGYLIENDTLVVFSTVQAYLDILESVVKSFVIEEDIILQGTVENGQFLKKIVKDIEKTYSPYAVLTCKILKENFVVHIVCGKDHYGPVSDDIKEKLEVQLVTKQDVHISPHIIRYMQKHSLDNIRKFIKANGIQAEVLDSNIEAGTLKVTGNAEIKQRVVEIIQAEVRKIYASWNKIEEDGIHDYFADGDGYSYLINERRGHQCDFRIATQNEMKNENMHCIVPLETGQTLFVGTGTLIDPTIQVEAIVNAANTHLDHRGGLAQALVKAGGKTIQDDCTKYIKRNGELQPGDVYVGTAGTLPCQRIIHAVGPEWKGGNNNEDRILQTAVENILEYMKKDKEFVLRSVAMPLISAGVFGFPKPRSAKIILQTIQSMLKKMPNVREVYFYDVNPDIVRTIQKQMHIIFGDRCFHLPVENIGLGKGTMTQYAASRNFKLQRTGSRILPLPGGKQIIIKWGELHSTAAEVLVNVTPTAPMPSGKISDSLKNAAGLKIDLKAECEKAFKKRYPNGDVPDGTMVSTKAGRILCSEIFHIKIKTSLDDQTPLGGYIKTCLQEAVRQKRTSIAFPTIGTTDCGYPGDKVAATFIRTIGEFMKLHMTCSLKEITVVIFKEDIVNTAAFEVIMEELYSQRPHRLLANIQETVQQKNIENKKDDEKDEQKYSSPQRPPSDVHKNRGTKQSACEGSFAVNSAVTVDLEIGGIENSKADAVVCTTSSFPKLNGAISNAIMKAGGPGIQRECNTGYKSYPNQGVASTKAGKLSCKRVFYVVLKDYNPNGTKDVYDSVLRCLGQAANDKFSSVAMPIFGTGGFKYPDKISASQMYGAIKEFYKRPRSFPTLITIVMYGPAAQTCKTFHQEARQMFSQMQAPSAPNNNANKVEKIDKYDGERRLWNVPKSSTSLEITYGNLELAKADVILSTTTRFPRLIGVIPDSLCKKAGPQLQQECNSFNGNVNSGMIVETKGYKLDCTQVYHYVMPDWTETNGEKVIFNCIDDCLQKMKTRKQTSIAIPSIGTGGAKYNPKKVARGIYRALFDYAAANSDAKCHVNLVLYPAATVVNKTFVEELQIFMTDEGKAENVPVKGVRFADEISSNSNEYADDNIVIPSKRRDFVLLQFISDDQKKIDLAFKSIKAKVEIETKETTIDLKKENNVDDIDLVTADKEKNKKKIEEIGENYHVKVLVNTKERKVKVRGIGDSVVKCYERVLKLLQEIRREAVSKDIGRIVYQHIEWYYTEDDGNLWVPYPKYIGFQLEDAFVTKTTEKEFRDSDGKHYVVDFKSMEEYVQKKKEKKTTVSVIRKDFTEGALHSLPLTWTVMEESKGLIEITLNPTDKEFKDVESNFMNTMGSFKISQINEIRRIQNRTLYQQYQTKKQQLMAEHKNKQDIELEQTLWHGIKESTEKSITSNGFNRSYAGATFGNAWYGMGVYFAVNSEYSTRNDYSPPDKLGWKRMYQVKVLTGLTTEVNKGYNERYAPLVPGSQTDRYNSTCDSVANPTEFVIYSDTQTYPEYIILFK